VPALHVAEPRTGKSARATYGHATQLRCRVTRRRQRRDGTAPKSYAIAFRVVGIPTIVSQC
jgi:hypothetical protein